MFLAEMAFGLPIRARAVQPCFFRHSIQRLFVVKEITNVVLCLKTVVNCFSELRRVTVLEFLRSPSASFAAPLGHHPIVAEQLFHSRPTLHTSERIVSH